jgi:hypothetical protein
VEEQAAAAAAVASIPVVGLVPNDDEDDMIQALRAAGLSPGEVASQRMAMVNLERRNAIFNMEQQQQQQPSTAALLNHQLDRENSVVVEIVTHDELVALLKCFCPATVHSNLTFGFTVSSSGTISWSIPPCRDCDPSHHYCRSDLHVKNRARAWVKKSCEKKRAPASLEY